MAATSTAQQTRIKPERHRGERPGDKHLHASHGETETEDETNMDTGTSTTATAGKDDTESG